MNKNGRLAVPKLKRPVGWIGKDVKITERRADKSITEVCGTTVDVEFRVDCLSRARYHLFIESPWSGQWAAGNVRIGSPMTKRLEVHQ